MDRPAFVLSHRDATRDLARRPIEIEAMGMSLGGIGVGYHRGDFTYFASDKAGQMMWSRTDLKPKDVDARKSMTASRSTRCSGSKASTSADGARPPLSSPRVAHRS